MRKKPVKDYAKIFREVGARNGKALLEKRGVDYFKRISAMRTKHGAQNRTQEETTTTSSEEYSL